MTKKASNDNNKKKHMYHFPVNDFTQKENHSLYFSSIVGQCKWPSQERNEAKNLAVIVT